MFYLVQACQFLQAVEVSPLPRDDLQPRHDLLHQPAVDLVRELHVPFSRLLYSEQIDEIPDNIVTTSTNTEPLA